LSGENRKVRRDSYYDQREKEGRRTEAGRKIGKLPQAVRRNASGEKIADLVRLEAIALGETFSFILNSPSKIVDKVMDVMAEFGLKLDEEAKNAKTPDEHKTKEETKAEDKAETNGKKTTRKSSAKKKTEE
jgi:hypothetical protein